MCSIANSNKRGSFQKTTIYYGMIFNLCVLKWKMVDSFQKKQQKHQFITVCYSTRGVSLLKKTKPNLLLYAIQLVCVLKWNKMDSFQKNTIYYSMLFNLCAYWNETRGTVFKKITKTPIYYSMLFNKRGSFQKKTIYYCMIFNLCVYWNETRGQFSKKSNLLQYATELMCKMKKEGQFSKKQQFITVCYSTCVRIEMKQEGQFSKKQKKTPIYYSMLFNLCAYWNETRWTVFKKTQFIIVCYSTCVRIEMKQEGQFSKK